MPIHIYTYIHTYIHNTQNNNIRKIQKISQNTKKEQKNRRTEEIQ